MCKARKPDDSVGVQTIRCMEHLDEQGLMLG